MGRQAPGDVPSPGECLGGSREVIGSPQGVLRNPWGEVPRESLGKPLGKLQAPGECLEVPKVF